MKAGPGQPRLSQLRLQPPQRLSKGGESRQQEKENIFDAGRETTLTTVGTKHSQVFYIQNF